jgi:hypothetical protein
MMYVLGKLLSPVMAIAGIGLMILGVLDRRDGLTIASAILLGSVLIAERPGLRPTQGDKWA